MDEINRSTSYGALFSVAVFSATLFMATLGMAALAQEPSSGADDLRDGADLPPVRWACGGPRDAAELTTRFEPGAVTVTWRGETSRLERVPTEVGAAYVGWDEAGGRSLRLRPDDRAVFTAGEVVVGCRAERAEYAGPGEPMPADASALELTTALVLDVPKRMKELFRVIGPIAPRADDPMPGVGLRHEFRDEGPISSAQLTAEFDPYHGDPDDPNPRLETWSVSLRGDPDGAHRILRSQYGAPTEILRPAGEGFPRDRSYFRYGPFYLLPWSSTFELSFRPREPEWAVPTLDEEAARREMARVERVLRGGVRRADLEAEFGPLGPDPWSPGLEAWTRHWHLRVRPAEGPPERITLTPRAQPIPAGSLLETLGLETGPETPVVVSRDVHQASRELADADLEPLRYGDWKVEICIDRSDLERIDTDHHLPTWTSQTFPVCGIWLERRGVR